MISATCFSMSVNGQIEWIDVLASIGSTFYCKYEIIFGHDWTIVKGLESAISQLATVRSNGEKIVLNLPIDIVFNSTNPYQWPQIVISVYKNMELVGYGRTYVPMQPNIHSFEVNLIRPQPSTFFGYIASFFGYHPELLIPVVLATNILGRGMLFMSSTGKVKLRLNVVQRGLVKLGYDVGKRK